MVPINTDEISFAIQFKGAILGIAGIAVSAVAIERVLSKIKETVVSFVSNLFFLRRARRAVRIDKVSRFREILQPTSIGLLVILVLVAFIFNDVSAADALKETRYYENRTGKGRCVNIQWTAPITATPTTKTGRGTIQRKSTVNRYVDSLWPDVGNPPADRSDQGYVWTEYFKIHWTDIVKNPNYDPDDSDTPRYWNGVYVDIGERGFREHGDEYMSGWEMQRQHMGARQGKKTACDGIEQVVWAVPGEWIFSGESEKVKSVYWLHSEIGEDPEYRLVRF